MKWTSGDYCDAGGSRIPCFPRNARFHSAQPGPSASLNGARVISIVRILREAVTGPVLNTIMASCDEAMVRFNVRIMEIC